MKYVLDETHIKSIDRSYIWTVSNLYIDCPVSISLRNKENLGDVRRDKCDMKKGKNWFHGHKFSVLVRNIWSDFPRNFRHKIRLDVTTRLVFIDHDYDNALLDTKQTQSLYNNKSTFQGIIRKHSHYRKSCLSSAKLKYFQKLPVVFRTSFWLRLVGKDKRCPPYI